MLRVIMTVFVLSVVLIGTPARADTPVGVRVLNTETSDRPHALTSTLWYPAGEGGELVKIGENAVFEGVSGRQDAPVRKGTFPVIVISFGGMRAAPNLASWIASDLATRGFIAIIVRPPSLGPGDAGMAVDEIWKRPADLTTVLSALQNDPEWSGHIDGEKIGALGFFLGGTSVLSLAGGRLDADSYVKTCDEGGTGLDCDWFADVGVDLHTMDLARLVRSNVDPRIKVAVAVDPELSASFSGESLSDISVPVKVINLGRADARTPGLDASMLADAAPQIEYTQLPDATQFSAFSLCKPKGADILEEDGGNGGICRSDAEAGRQTIHAELAELIAGFLNQHLGNAP